MTSDRRVADVQEMIWRLEQKYGPIVPEVIDQVAVAHAIAEIGPGAAAADVRTAFTKAGIRPPGGSYVNELTSMLARRVKRRALIDEILAFRQYAIGALSRQFGGKTHSREGELRNYLRTYLQPRGWVEAEAGKGDTDLIIPSEDTLIETKVWESIAKYEDALEQVRRYIHSEAPRAVYIVMFGDRHPLPSIIDDPTQAIADEPVLSGLKVPVIVVPFEVDYPSKARTDERKRARSGR